MKTAQEHQHGGFLYSTRKDRLDVSFIHDFLSNKSYWAQGIPLSLVKQSIENSLCVGIYENDKQVGFARVITDHATFGYLADVFVDEPYRGRGLSKGLMEFIFSFDDLKILRRIVLATRDAHTLYQQYGFTPLKQPDRFMELHRPDIYSSSPSLKH